MLWNVSCVKDGKNSLKTVATISILNIVALSVITTKDLILHRLLLLSNYRYLLIYCFQCINKKRK